MKKFRKKFARDIGDITFIGIGLGAGMAIEGKVQPAVPVFTKFAPLAANIATIKGAGMVLNSMKMLERVGKKRRK